MEQFGQNERELFEMPESATGVEERLRDYAGELESSDYENLSVEDKHKALDKIEEEISLMDSKLEGIFVNPKEDSDYHSLKELIEQKKELVFKKRRAILH